MEKNLVFSVNSLQSIAIKVAWPQLEVDFDNGTDLRVLVAGDDVAVAQLKVQQLNDSFLVEQPQFGLWKNYRLGSWMQIMLKIPKSYKHALHITTVSGDCIVHGFEGRELDLNSVSGKLMVHDVKTQHALLDSVSGSLSAKNLSTQTLTSKSVSGVFVYDHLSVDVLKATAVSANQQYHITNHFKTLDINSVTGNIDLTQPYDSLDVKLLSVNAHIFYDGVKLNEEQETDAPKLNLSIVSGSVNIKKY